MADVKVTLTLSENAVKFLKEEAARTERPMADVVRQAIKRTQRIREARDHGATIVVKDPAGREKTFEIED